LVTSHCEEFWAEELNEFIITFPIYIFWFEEFPGNMYIIIPPGRKWNP
jgi:hypothetical protein